MYGWPARAVRPGPGVAPMWGASDSDFSAEFGHTTPEPLARDGGGLQLPANGYAADSAVERVRRRSEGAYGTVAAWQRKRDQTSVSGRGYAALGAAATRLCGA